MVEKYFKYQNKANYLQRKIVIFFYEVKINKLNF